MNAPYTDWTREDLIDLIADAIDASVDMDWTAHDGAQYVLDRLDREKLCVAPDLAKLVVEHGLASITDSVIAAPWYDCGYSGTTYIQWLDSAGERQCISNSEGSHHQQIAAALADREARTLLAEDAAHDARVDALDVAGEAA